MIQKIKSKLNNKPAKIAAAVILLALVGLGIYELQQKYDSVMDRISNVESEVNQLNSEATFADGTPINNDDLSYQELSKTTESLRIENDTTGPDQDTTYESKQYFVYKLRVTNKSSSPQTFMASNVRGKTKSGTLVDARDYGIHPDSLKDRRTTVSLAPGGSAEVYVFIPSSEGEVELYFQPNEL